MLELKEILFAYCGEKKAKWIFNHVSYRFNAGNMYTVYGEKGAGKTTLLLLLSALEAPSVGMVFFQDTELWRIGESRYRKYHTSLIRERDNLLLYYNAYRNVLEAARISGNNAYRSEDSVMALLEKMGIDRGAALKNVKELTPGEQQRVAVAKALAAGTQVILADEPVGGLDVWEAEEIIALLHKAAKEENKCVILATDNIEMAEHGDVVLHIREQNLIEQGREESEEQRATRARLAERYGRSQENQHNTKLLYKVLLKNFKSNWRSFLQFFSSTVLSVTLLFAVFAIQYMLKGFSGREGGDVLHEGMGGMVTSSIAIIAVLTTFLMMFSQQNYIRDRMKDYAVFTIVGIRGRAVNFMMAVEYIGSFLFSAALGLAAGNAAVFIFRQVLVRNYPEKVNIPYPEASTYLLTLVVAAGIFLLSFIIIHEYYVEAELGKSMQMEIRSEKMSGKAGNLLMIGGCVIAIVSLIAYSGRGTGELWYFWAVFLAGIYLLAKNAGMKVLNGLRRKSGYYYRNLLSLNQFYYRYQSNARSMLFLFVLQFMLLFYLPVQVFPLLPMDIEAEYPYDYMMYCSVEQTDYVKELAQEYGVDYKELPAVRVNVAKGSSYPLNYEKTWNQGENIGLSESSYKKLSEEKTDKKRLRGKEIAIVFQEGRSQPAHPLDWTSLKEQPAIRFGPARQYDPYTEREIFSEKFPLTAQKRQIDVGVFGSGMHENIVVFSDEYFKEIDEGNVLVLINVPAKYTDEVKASLVKFEKENLPVHMFNRQIKSLYSKTEAVETRRAEDFLKIALDVFFFLAFMFSNFFIVHQKLCSDIPYLKRKYEMLNCVGMRFDKQKKLLSREIYIFWMLPLIFALLMAAVFTGITLNMRFYSESEWACYLGLALPYTVVFCVLQLIGIIGMRRFLVRQVLNKYYARGE